MQRVLRDSSISASSTNTEDAKLNRAVELLAKAIQQPREEAELGLTVRHHHHLVVVLIASLGTHGLPTAKPLVCIGKMFDNRSSYPS
jgi:hypothetical protein